MKTFDPSRYMGAPSRQTRPVPGFTMRRNTARQVAQWKWLAWVLLVGWWWVPALLVVWVMWTIIVLGWPVIAASYNHILKWAENGNRSSRP